MGDTTGSRRLITGIMVAVAVWGGLLALGAWRLNHDVRRTFVVAGCTAAFLGFWGTMLALRTRRMRGRRP